MKNPYSSFLTLPRAAGIFVCLMFTAFANSTFAFQIVDDFNHPDKNSSGVARQFMTDTVAGGKTTADLKTKEGVMRLKGEIEPPRGQPGWASLVIVLEEQGAAVDLSSYEGIKVKLKTTTGLFSISANSLAVTNFDYHAAPMAVAVDGQFHEVLIPFKSMKPTWSALTPLDLKTVNSLSIVSFGMQKSSFDFELDEVSFY